jgi:DNA-binding MarR family transcriptional regulator
MSSNHPPREELVAALSRLMRMMSATGVVLSETVAARVGLNSTDMECLDLLSQEGPTTARRLGEVTGLTTGAVTSLIDRLEKAGYVRRTPNPRDRRSVLVEPLTERIARDIGPYYVSIARSMAEIYAQYSDEDLARTHDFLTRVYQGSLEEVARLRKEAPPET